MSRKKTTDSTTQLDLFKAPERSIELAAPLTPEEISLPEGLRLERNVAILAGAGAGKTYSLVTMCLHLLGGARVGFEPLPCASLGLLTFTEKAADEMRGRLRARLDALAEGQGDEPALLASFEAAGQPFPSPRKWRGIRDELGAATIGTFHSLCMQLLRNAPPNSGVWPHFELLDERDANALVRDVVERTVLAAVEKGSPLRTLVAEIGFDRLIDGLVPTVTRIREEGVLPEYVRIADGPTLRFQFDTALMAFQRQVREVQPATSIQRQALQETVRVGAALSFEAFESHLPLLRETLKGARGPVGELRDAVENVAQLYAACLVAPFEAEVRSALVDIARAHHEALRARGVLDFTGLLVQARNLLRDFPQARVDAQRRLKALLVDEFQDTNRLQLELVLLLSEKRLSAPRPVSSAFEMQHQEIVQLPQEPGFLAVVGDRKQSIYEFRGADVSVFEVMAKAIETSGGGRAYLRHSRRSTAPLLETLNVGFGHALGPAAAGNPPADFEVLYQPEHDDLTAVRKTSPSGMPLLQLEDSRMGPSKRTAEELRAADAQAVALALSHGLSGGWAVMDRGEDAQRPARGGDVAMLFQRFTQLEMYRQALVRQGVRHRVVRGRGFYGAQEVVDLASLLALLADPDDALSLSAVLRSPLVGLTDSQWVGLARPRSGELWHLDAREIVLGNEREVPAPVTSFRIRYQALKAEQDRLGLCALLRVILDVFEYRVAIAAGPFGEQALANVEKLLVLATAREARGTSVAAFAQELKELADEAPKEAQGEVVDEGDLQAVTLCTVHQAKGLEWPIVVLPDLATAPRNETAAIRFDRDLGLSVVRPKGASDLRSLSATRITQQLSRRARAENLRLLYVAMTRARDRLVLGLRPLSSGQGTWAKDLNAFFALRVSGEKPEHLDVAVLPAQGALDDEAPPDTEVSSILAQVRRPLVGKVNSLVLPVTQMQDLALCPRRFHLAHQVGLPELLDVQTSGRSAQEVDVRSRGTSAHRLLERTPLALVGTPELSHALRALRRTLGLEHIAGDDVLTWVERFWATPFARSLPSLKVHRELPFALRLEHQGAPTLILRGQIDLLVMTDDEVLVIDYKTSTQPAAGLEAYRFQLGCYALAAQRFVGQPCSIRSGVVFLRDPSPEPQFLPPTDFQGLPQKLAEDCVQLVKAQNAGQWPGHMQARCEELRCGYVYRCHAR